VNKQVIALTGLQEFLRTTFEARKEKTLFLIGDPSLRYGEVIAVIDAAKGAGVEKVGIVTEGMRKGESTN
jgi:biopolymer transport protein ExbD